MEEFLISVNLSENLIYFKIHKKKSIFPSQKYQNKVLIGNWFEDRVILAKSKDRPTNSEYQENFNTKIFRENNSELFKNKFKNGENIPFCLYNGSEYLQNMTASNDLHYNIIPSKLCGPAERRYNTAALTYLPEQDYLKSYVSFLIDLC